MPSASETGTLVPDGVKSKPCVSRIVAPSTASEAPPETATPTILLRATCASALRWTLASACSAQTPPRPLSENSPATSTLAGPTTSKPVRPLPVTIELLSMLTLGGLGACTAPPAMTMPSAIAEPVVPEMALLWTLRLPP